eukprot:TRINITY_DN25079_c0_g1_i1.p1 TRINITY_DN25079_c0_g1~~TRINITY_DN25079_c0_g1_i1.p1  ORF type:complete len:1107 (-),score=202.03 TRINITY_DN25079_c0_g1_i1:91-3411(-)
MTSLLHAWAAPYLPQSQPADVQLHETPSFRSSASHDYYALAVGATALAGAFASSAYDWRSRCCCCRRSLRKKPVLTSLVRRSHGKRIRRVQTQPVPRLHVLREPADIRGYESDDGAMSVARSPRSPMGLRTPFAVSSNQLGEKNSASCPELYNGDFGCNEDSDSPSRASRSRRASGSRVSASFSGEAGQLIASQLLLHALAPQASSSQFAAVHRLLSDSGLCLRNGLPSPARRRSFTQDSSLQEASVLGSLFDSEDRDGDGRISKSELLSALRKVDEHLSEIKGQPVLQLTGDDVERLAKHLGLGRSSSVARRVFVESMQDLLSSLAGLGGLTVGQLKDLIFYCFEEIDKDGDGRIAVGEFIDAISRLGITLSPAALRRLHSFLDFNKDGFVDRALDAPSSPCGTTGFGVELWAGAFQVALHAQYKRKGLDKATILFEKLQGKVQGAKSPIEFARCLFSALTDFSDLISDYVELSNDVGAFFLALASAYRELAEAKSWSDFDVQDFLSFLVLLGVSGVHMTEELSPVSDLSVEEAYVYVKVFQTHGCTAREFRQLLNGAGAEVTMQRGSSGLDSAMLHGRLHFIARGTCFVQNFGASDTSFQLLGPGAAVGALEFLSGEPSWSGSELVMDSDTCLLSFDFGRLRAYLQRHQALAQYISSVLTDSLSDFSRVAAVPRINGRAGSEQNEPHLEPSLSELDKEPILERSFDLMDEDGDGQISTDELLSGLQWLREQGSIDLVPTPDMAQRLSSLLGTNEAGRVTRAKFIEGMQELSEAISGLGGLTVSQLSEILRCALERFDENADGQISVEEFAAALNVLGFNVSPQAVGRLHSLLDLDGDGFISGPDASALAGSVGLGRLTSAFQVAMKEQYKRVVEPKVTSLATLEGGAGVGPGANSVDDLQDLLDAGLDTAAFFTAIAGIYREIAGHGVADLDPSKLAPFLIFMGLSGIYMARELSMQEVTDMTEDEVLLYAREFRNSGFSLMAFRRFLREGGSVWRDFAPGESLSEVAGCVSFIVRGSVLCRPDVVRSHGPLGEGRFLRTFNQGLPEVEEWRAAENGVRLVSFEMSQLNRYLALDKGSESRLRSLLQGAAASKTLEAQSSPSPR